MTLTEQSWNDLIDYYLACIKVEMALNYSCDVGELKRIWPIGGTDTFVDSAQPTMIYQPAPALRKNFRAYAGLDKAFQPSLIYADQLYVNQAARKVIPLRYIRVKVTATSTGYVIRRDDFDDVGIHLNIGPMLEYEEGQNMQDATQRFYESWKAETAEHADTALGRDLMIKELARAIGHPPDCIDWKPDLQYLNGERLKPYAHSILNFPVLMEADERLTQRLQSELRALRQEWNSCPNALKQLIECNLQSPYPVAPPLKEDNKLYIVDTNERQRQAVYAAERVPVTVVTGPPGTGKSQLILNIIGDHALRGESVLLASNNNEAVDVVFRRLFDKTQGYLGAVRSGNNEKRKEIGPKVAQALSKIQVRSGESALPALQQRLTELRNRRAKLQTQLDTAQRLEAEHQIFRAEWERQRNKSEDIKKRAEVLEKRCPPLSTAAAKGLSDEIQRLQAQMQRCQTDFDKVLTQLKNALRADDLAPAILNIRAATEDQLPRWFVDKLEEPRSWKELRQRLDEWRSVLRAAALNSRLQNLQRDIGSLVEQQQAGLQKLPQPLQDELSGLDVASLGTLPATTSFEQSKAKLDTLVTRVETFQRMLIEEDFVCAIWEHIEPGTPMSDEFSLLSFQAKLRQMRQAAQFMVAQRTRQNLIDALAQHEAQHQRQQQKFESEQAVFDTEQHQLREHLPFSLANHVLDYTGPTPIAATTATFTQQQAVRGRHIFEKKAKGIDAIFAVIDKRGGLRRVIDRTWQTLAQEPAGRHILEHMGQPPEKSAEQLLTILDQLADSAQLLVLFQHRQKLQAAWQTWHEQHEQKHVSLQEALADAEARLESSAAEMPASLRDVVATVLVKAVPEDSRLASFAAQLDSLATTAQALLKKVDDDEQSSGLTFQSLTSQRQDATAQLNPKIAALTHAQFQQSLQILTVRRREKELQAGVAEILAERGEVLQKLIPEIQIKMAGPEALAMTPREMDAGLTWLLQLEERWSQQRQTWLAYQADYEQLLKKHGKVIDSAGIDKRAPDEISKLVEQLERWQTFLPLWQACAQHQAKSLELEQHGTASLFTSDLAHCTDDLVTTAAQVLGESWLENAGKLSRERLSQAQKFVTTLQDYANASDDSRSGYTKSIERLFSAGLALFPIWAVTNLSTQFLPLTPGVFDCVIIDEASQCNIASALPLLFRAKRIVIIGDQLQLPHISQIPADEHGRLQHKHQVESRHSHLSQSLFKLASHASGHIHPIFLNEHYRCHEEIIEFSNAHVYDHRLTVKTRLDVPDRYLDALGLFWLNTTGPAQHITGANFNVAEQNQVVELVERLTRFLKADPRLAELQIGVVTPFRRQKNELETRLKKFGAAVTTGTVHTFQGNERDIMILSLVASDETPQSSLRFLTREPNLLNVAVTRARKTLIVVGNHDFLVKEDIKHLSELAQYAQDRQRVFTEIDSLPWWNASDETLMQANRVVRPNESEQARNHLVRLIGSCRSYLWWADPYMTTLTLDLLDRGIHQQDTDNRVKSVRLLTEQKQLGDKRFDLAKLEQLRIKLLQSGVELELRVGNDKQNTPHDRYLLTNGNRAYNVPPIDQLDPDKAKQLRLCEFSDSLVSKEDFENYWKEAVPYLKQ